MRIALVTRESTRPGDAIRAHSQTIAEAFCGLGNEAMVVERTQTGSWRAGGAEAGELADAIEPFDLAILAYNPFMYGRRGIAPWLARELVRVSRRRMSTRLVLHVHEPYVRATSARSALHGAYLRTQLGVLRLGADIVFASIEAWADALERWLPRRPTAHVPSGSVLPDRRWARDETRQRLGISDSTVVVATLSSGHPSHMERYASRAVAAAARECEVVMLALGAGARSPVDPAGARWVAPGLMSDDDLARHLSAADVFLSPLDDGVSTRRTSVMAALQHGVAVVGTRGYLTDSELASSDALTLVSVDDEDAFVTATRALALDRERRGTLGAAGRLLFDERYAPERLATRMLAACAR